MITQAQAIEILKRQYSEAQRVRATISLGSDYTTWKRNTEIAIQKIFGLKTRHFREFNHIHFTPRFVPSSAADKNKAFHDGFVKTSAILESMMQELHEYGLEDSQPSPDSTIDAVTNVKRMCSRFHLVASQLRGRHAQRPTLEVDDEYDVQDLLHALLRLDFDDVRPEDYSPSYAGGASRVDFLLKAEQIVVEAKKTRKGLAAKEVGEQLIIDIGRYQTHPDCKCLICFVYDPEARIVNPRGLENDLMQRDHGIKVIVIITPR